MKLNIAKNVKKNNLAFMLMMAFIVVIVTISQLMAQSINVNFKDLPEWTNSIYYPLYFNAERYTVLYGGAGSGKSHFQAQKIVYLITAEPGHNALILRKVARSSRHSTFALICRIINDWGLNRIFHINKSDMTITCWPNGNMMIFAGLDDVEKLKSVTFPGGILTDIWIEEATECTERDITQLDLRLRGLAPVRFQMTLSFNPVSALHWVKKRFFDRVVPNCKILKTTYKDNRFLDSGYRATLEDLKNIDRTYYDIYCMGDWGVYGDLVFTNYETYNFNIDREWDRVISGLDFGWNHYQALEKIGILNNELYFFNEIYAREMTNTEFIDLNKEENVLTNTDNCIADSADPAAIKEWCDAGYDVVGAKKGKDSRRAGYTYLKTRKLHIHKSNCPGIAAEIQTLKYKEDKDGNPTDEVIEFKDDAFAAARYATEPLWNTGGSAFAIITDIGV